ncbi:MAG: hypothetical protein ACYSU0_02935, partial [Planctomycetota bacterium]
MRDHLRGLAALVFAVVWGGAAWSANTTISYPVTTGNDVGASDLGGKTITLDWTGTQPAPGDVDFEGVPVDSLPSRFGGSCTVLVSGSGGSGTIDIEVPPEQTGLGWDRVVGITAGDSVPINFTYWRTPTLNLRLDGEMQGQYQQSYEGGEIIIYGTDFPEPTSPGSSTLLYGRTVMVEFGS